MNLSQLGEPLRKKGKYQVFFSCPCHDDESGHLGVHIKKGIYHCFKCGTSGRIKNLEISLSEFETIVQEKLRPDQGRTDLLSKASPPLELPREYKLVSLQSGLPFRYLNKRLVTTEELLQYHIGYCSTGIFQERIIVPIYEQHKLVYFVGRTYTGREPKYMNAPVEKGHIVFKTFNDRVEEAIVCEGIFDALRIGKVIPAISLLGKVASKYQIQTIRQLTNSAIVMLDSDANVEAFKLYSLLRMYMPTRILMIDKHDPGSMTIEQLKEVI